ncbi:MAG: dihydrofolate reductase [Candidatus Saccharibacteria bacterium]|nr:dihydrofolate reductase [Candidatus Saccharibacteria bacterium]
MIRFIAAIDAERGIANDHGIPWRGKIPGDIAHFRASTLHSTIMMGYGWYNEQIKPLPERKNLVATSQPVSLRPGFEKIIDAREFLEHAKDDIWVGGGAGLFASTLDLAHELHLTILETSFQCTKFFPEYSDAFIQTKTSEPITENGITYRITVWKRK